MSELKATTVYNAYWTANSTWQGTGVLVYLKSEADKAIACHKYKRCLAMASRCFSKSNYHFVLARHGEDGKKNNRKSILYSKWHKRWLDIADKLKKAK